ncbi:hypothetical protein K502DRAFT_347103 [Neoconidiobolus thromboides FSU 785]|nr:hypothetical protein K502DRAFT_347103 [Neoconidiobolus thromboides FSU 785]
MNKEIQKFGDIPNLSRRQIVLGLGRLSLADIRTLFMLWVRNKLLEGKKILSKELKEDIEYRLSILNQDLEKLNKRDFVLKWVDGFMEGKISPFQEAQLETSYFLRNQTKIKWNVYHMKRSRKSSKGTEEIAPEIARIISDSLAPYFSKLVYAAKDENNMWLRVAIYQGHTSNVVYPKVYIVYRPETNFFLASTIRSDIRPYLLQALSEAFSLSAIDTLPLSGNNPKSLLDLVLNQYSQGPFSHYRLGQVDKSPLHMKEFTVDIPKDYKPTGYLPKNIEDEDKVNKGKQKFYTKERFGTNEQPVINSLFLKVDLEYRQNPTKSDPLALSEHGSPFSMSIKFEGHDILEGLRELSFISPLAPYLENVSSKRTNYLEIKPEDEFRF